VIIIVTEQMLGGKPILKRLRRKALFAFCQMVLRPGEEGRQTRRAKCVIGLDQTSS
jgi:hypothetical protein